MTNWWALAIYFNLFWWRNLSVMSAPHVQPAPLGLTPHPALASSGSLQSKSHIAPSCGTSWNLFNYLIYSTDSIAGESPPCEQKILNLKLRRLLIINPTYPSTIAANGRYPKTSVKYFQASSLPYLRKHSS